jgi:predicted phosphodiesterase
MGVYKYTPEQIDYALVAAERGDWAELARDFNFVFATQATPEALRHMVYREQRRRREAGSPAPRKRKKGSEPNFQPRTDVTADLKRVLFVPDTHVPYHDQRAWALLMHFAREWKPHIIVLLGDFADFYAVSAHDKNPLRVRSLAEEVRQVREALDELESLGAERLVYVQGNHEQRLERYLMTKAPELFDSVTCPGVLNLDLSKWEWVPYREHARIGKIFVTHDTGTAGATAHQKSQADFQDNVVIGHTHRMAYSIHGSAHGVPHVAAMFGWLGDRLQTDYMHSIKAARDWALGFGIGYMQPSGVMHLTPVPLVDYTCVVDGRFYRG